MKKVIVALCMFIAGVFVSSAQEGQKALGVNLGVAPVIETGGPTNFGIGAKFQYNITDPIRVEADLEYWFKSKGQSVFDVYANIHYLIPVVDKLKIYPLAGIGYGNLHLSWDGYSGNLGRFIFNIGVGADYEIADNLVANFEFKYQYMKDFGRIPITIGVAYKF